MSASSTSGDRPGNQQSSSCASNASALSGFVEAYVRRASLGAPASASSRRGPIPRILFVDNQVSDFLRYRMGLATALQRAGFQVHVALPRGPDVEQISHQGVYVHTFYLRRLSMRASDELRAWASLVRVYRRVQPMMTHLICLKPALYGGLAGRLTGVSASATTLTGLGHLFTARTLTVRVLRMLVGRALQCAFAHPNHRLILQNSDDESTLIASGIVKKPGVVIIKGSGVDVSVFKPEPEPDGQPIVLMPCRLLWEKGVGEFVNAAKELRARGVRARFVLIGEPDRDHPSAIPAPMLKQWTDAGDVEWLGRMDDMPTMIAQCHIVCLPSYYGEGVPRVLLEAAACARAIVTTDSPGCREVVRDGHNGFVVPPRNSAALVEPILKLVHNVALRKAMGRRGRELAVAEFSLDRTTEATLGVYRSLLVSGFMSQR